MFYIQKNRNSNIIKYRSLNHSPRTCYYKNNSSHYNDKDCRYRYAQYNDWYISITWKGIITQSKTTGSKRATCPIDSLISMFLVIVCLAPEYLIKQQVQRHGIINTYRKYVCHRTVVKNQLFQIELFPCNVV